MEEDIDAILSWRSAHALRTPKNHNSHGFLKIAVVLGYVLATLLCTRPAFAADQYGGASLSSEEMTGVPWEGEAGIIESVGEIMKRETALRRISGTRSPRVIPFRRMPDRESAPQNPDSPPVSGTPATGGASRLFSVTPYTPQIVGPINFTGATLADTLAYPPDSMGAVGPTQYIVAVNGRIRSFNKTHWHA